MTAERPDVLVEAFGIDPAPLLAELQRYNLSAEARRKTLPHDPALTTARALLLATASRQFGIVRDRVNEVWREALNVGANLIVAVPLEEIDIYKDWINRHFKSHLPKTPDLAHALFAVSGSRPRDVANRIVQLKHERPPSSVSLSPRLPPADELLLSRAFNDFGKVVLTELHGGKTSQVYRVDAIRLSGGLRPLPYVAKLASREKIIHEFDNFVVNVADYVPFPARPNLIRERCLIGAEKGILVGQFIEDSETLAHAILRASSPQLLHEVFERLLYGWWRLGERDSGLSDRPVLAAMSDWFESAGKPARDDALRKHHKLASKTFSLGLLSPQDLRTALRSIRPCHHRHSLIHGDLHAGNIHVRGSEVYLIDFGSVIEGPILADAAMLEASLILSAGTLCKKGSALSRWRVLVRQHLYRDGWDTEIPPREPSIELVGPLRCLWAAIRVIRLHVLGMRISPQEYAPLVAAAHVRLASFDDSSPAERSNCVAHLYGVASQIVTRVRVDL